MTIWRKFKNSTVTNQINAVLTALIVLMTGVNVVFFVKQVWDQDRQVRDIKHAITDGIKMAKGAIDSSLAHNTTALDKVLNSNNVSLAKSLTQML